MLSKVLTFVAPSVVAVGLIYYQDLNRRAIEHHERMIKEHKKMLSTINEIKQVNNKTISSIDEWNEKYK